MVLVGILVDFGLFESLQEWGGGAQFFRLYVLRSLHGEKGIIGQTKIYPLISFFDAKSVKNRLCYLCYTAEYFSLVYFCVYPGLVG